MASEVENGYTFRMGDHEITMRDSFASMLDTTQLTDCLLVCHTHLKDGVIDGAVIANGLTNGHISPVPSLGGRSSVATATSPAKDQILRTHKVILSASSDYFRSVFSSVPNTLNSGVVAVIITNVDFDDLQAIIDFIYKGQVSVGQSRIHKFLAAAQLLMIKGLMNIKLVNTDDQPIDESFGESELIHKLKADKRRLELEVRAVRETEKYKIERIRRDIEIELKKKFELEKSVLSEEKQRFEAEKMKFTIEKEVFEKNKLSAVTQHKLNNSPNNCLNNTSNKSNKQIVVNNNNRSILIETLNGGQNSGQKSLQNESVIKSPRSLRGSPIKPTITPAAAGAATASSAQSSPQKTDSVNNSLPEPPTIEPEGRQLRKRLKLGDPSDESGAQESTGGQTADKHNNNDEEQQMEVEEEDGEVYEVDFSQPQDVCQSGADGQPDSKQSEGEPSANNEAETGTGPSTQAAAIVASTMAYHKVANTTTPTTSTNVTPSHQTRSLRRSTSSIGSASTQSMGGENGTPEAGAGEPVVQRRKGPGRTPNWAKQEELAALAAQNMGTEATPELDSTPLTRARQQRVSQELTPVSGTRQSATSQLYTCPYCPQVYHGHQSMQDHINGVHLNQKTQYICDYCGKVYTWRISLNKHLRTVHPNEPIPE